MPTRSAKADWRGDFQDGGGQIHLSVGDYGYSTRARLDDEERRTITPEEFIAAAQATCYNMALTARLNSQRLNPESLETTAKVTLSPSGLGFKVSRITISVTAKIPNITAEAFKEHAQIAKETCPISLALAAVPITLETHLLD